MEPKDKIMLHGCRVGRDRRPNVVILECFIHWWERGKVGKMRG